MIETLGLYKILDRIGTSAMGEVFRARDTRLGRTVAITVMSPDIAGHPGRRERFVITHAHWDHTSGLLDLPRPRVLLGPGEAEFVRAFPADKPPTAMPHHLAGAELETFAWDGPAFETFPSSHDLFGDGAVVLVPLPGHTPGSLGVFLTSVRGRRVFLIGDAGWSRDAFEHPSHKLAPLSEIVDHEPARLSETLWRIHHLAARDATLLIVPAHDERAIEALRDLATTPAIEPR